MHASNSLTLALLLTLPVFAVGQETVVVRPKEIDDVLVNPGIGFTTFQRFNGDRLNEGLRWTEGFPIEYQPDAGTVTNKDHPLTSIAYFRVYWKFVEPAPGAYAWELFDKALATARARHQALMLRIAPYGTGTNTDVPAWYRTLANEEPGKKLPVEKWQVNPEDPLYVQRFGGMIRAWGARYDGHPDLELVDVSVVGAWGEGAGSELLTESTRRALLDCYLESFHRTPLVLQLQDAKSTHYALSKQPVGWRVDCLGDMGGFSPTWSHMNDYYPQTLVQTGMQEAWKKAPVTMEVCWVMQHWKNQGWDIDHIIDESLKWHISSFNAKSSPVPAEWQPQVSRWLKKMGYRLVLRKFTYPAAVKSQGKLEFTSWWDNKGVAPCYRRSPLALRLKNPERTEVLLTEADITSWLPGDSLFDSSVSVPVGMPGGDYDLGLALVDPDSRQPKVRLANAGQGEDGWQHLGKVRVESAPADPSSSLSGNLSGIAARYPGDVGIERDSHVLFAENFETGTIAEIGKRWGEMSNSGGKVLAFSDDAAPGSTGKRSLQLTATLGENTGGHLYTRLARGVEQVFARFYVKFAADAAYIHHFVTLGGYNPPTAWPQGGAGERPRGDDRFTAGIEPFGQYGRFPAPGAWNFYAYWPEMKGSADGKYWGNGLVGVEPALTPRDRWQCVEVMLRCNSTPEKSDGELALWLDGKPVAHFRRGAPRSPWTGMGFRLLEDGGEPFEGFRWRTNTDLKVNFFWLLHYVTENAARQNKVASPSRTNRVWFDDIVVSTEYVGPIRRRTQ